MSPTTVKGLPAHLSRVPRVFSIKSLVCKWVLDVECRLVGCLGDRCPLSLVPHYLPIKSTVSVLTFVLTFVFFGTAFVIGFVLILGSPFVSVSVSFPCQLSVIFVPTFAVSFTATFLLAEKRSLTDC